MGPSYLNYNSCEQTSGTVSLADHIRGAFASSKVYDDADLSDLLGLSETVPNRETDLAVSRAGDAGDVRTCIICPPAICMYTRILWSIQRTHLIFEDGGASPALFPAPIPFTYLNTRCAPPQAGLGLLYWDRWPTWSASYVEDVASLHSCLLSLHQRSGRHHKVSITHPLVCIRTIPLL